MALTAFGHLGFTVSDMDRSVEWYSTLLRCEPLDRKTWRVPYIGELVGYPGCEMECAYFPLPGGGRLELLRYLIPPPGRGSDMETYNAGNGHLCLIVDDIHAEVERLRPIATPRSPAPVQSTWGPHKGGWGCYLRDPDGITIELQQPPRR